MSTEQLVVLAVTLLTGGGFGSLIAILIKGGPERQSIIVGSAERALAMQSSVIDGLQREIQRRDAIIEAQRLRILHLEEKLA